MRLLLIAVTAVLLLGTGNSSAPPVAAAALVVNNVNPCNTISTDEVNAVMGQSFRMTGIMRDQAPDLKGKSCLFAGEGGFGLRVSTTADYGDEWKQWYIGHLVNAYHFQPVPDISSEAYVGWIAFAHQRPVVVEVGVTGPPGWRDTLQKRTQVLRLVMKHLRG